jgi:hypothetical protein
VLPDVNDELGKVGDQVLLVVRCRLGEVLTDVLERNGILAAPRASFA